MVLHQVEAVIHFEDDTEELQQWDQQVNSPPCLLISWDSQGLLQRLLNWDDYPSLVYLICLMASIVYFSSPFYLCYFADCRSMSIVE